MIIELHYRFGAEWWICIDFITIVFSFCVGIYLFTFIDMLLFLCLSEISDKKSNLVLLLLGSQGRKSQNI